MKTADKDVSITYNSTHFVPMCIHHNLFKMEREPSVVGHAHIPFIWKVEAGELGIKAS